MNDYIFCPLCGTHEWIHSKTQKYDSNKMLEIFKCKECDKFHYANFIESTSHSSFIKERYYERGTIGKYEITIFFKEKFFNIRDADSLELLVSIKCPFPIDWYLREETLLHKIKTYMVFS